MVDNKSQTFITDTVKYRNETDTRIRQTYKKYITLISEVQTYSGVYLCKRTIF